MIHLHFDLQNPWHNEIRCPWRDIYQKSWALTKNKTLEICLDFYPFVFAHFHLDTRWRGYDHAGIVFSIGLLGFGFQLQFHDNRHWNDETNDWVKYE